MVIDDVKGYRRALLLQGPVGPFFYRLGQFLKQGGSEVFKVNFNGGDALYYPGNARKDGVFSFRGKPADWRRYIEQFITRHGIDVMFLFGNCRFYHRVAIKIARRRGVAVYVFEEGYIRPDYITMERDGVNGNSTLPNDANFYARLKEPELVSARPVGNMFWPMALFAYSYSIAGMLMAWRYRNYKHHRAYFSLAHWIPWIKAGWRKLKYRIKEQGVMDRLCGSLNNRYFLVPLQVHNDAQITYHSSYESVAQFIAEIIPSFARHAPTNTHLVIKHHPLDRGFRDYTQLIRSLASAWGVADRVVYVHDLHLPTLLRNAVGTVTINSTVGLSSLFHGTPVRVQGGAIYDIPGLTHQGSLDAFWSRPGKIDTALYRKFKAYVIRNTQINGSFYFLRDFVATFSTGERADRRPELRPVGGSAQFRRRRASVAHTAKPHVQLVPTAVMPRGNDGDNLPRVAP